MRLSGGVFMGIIFLTVGIILLLNSFFNFNINIFKLIIGSYSEYLCFLMVLVFKIAKTLSLEKE